MKKKKQATQVQAYWRITSYHNITNSEGGEIDDGYFEFTHEDIKQPYLKEISWAQGKGAYDYEGYRPPTLLDVWEIFRKITPGTQGFTYRNWAIKKMSSCFMYILTDPEKKPIEMLYKSIVSDRISRDRQDFAAFLWMLDNIEKEIEENKPKKVIFDLDSIRKQRKDAG